MRADAVSWEDSIFRPSGECNGEAVRTAAALRYRLNRRSPCPFAEEFFRKVHRFYCDSFEAVCELCKELHRIVAEPIDIGLLNSKIDPTNAVKANEQKLRQIRRLALWLDSLGLDGRKVIQPLGGIAELRQGDAHAKGSELESSLALFGIPKSETNLQVVCCEIIGQAANCVGTIARVIEVKAGT